MSLDDFCRLTFEEIDEILRCWSEAHRDRIHGEWEKMRMHTFLMLRPFCTKLPEPKQLLPFPWEDLPEEVEPEAPMSAEERQAALEAQKRKLGWG